MMEKNANQTHFQYQRQLQASQQDRKNLYQEAWFPSLNVLIWAKLWEQATRTRPAKFMGSFQNKAKVLT